MLQLLAQRQFADDQKPVFVYAETANGNPIHIASISVALSDHAKILSSMPEAEWYNLYYTLAHHVIPAGASKPTRKAGTFDFQTVLAFDIDKADGARAYEYADIVAEVLSCARDHLSIVCSGNGVHVLADLKHPIRSAKYFDENREAFTMICARITQEMAKKSLPGVADPSVFDPARVLRFPGTRNIKPDIPEKMCSLVQRSKSPLDIDLMKLSGLDQIKKENVDAKELKRNFPAPDFGQVRKECRFMDWVLTKPDETKEPHVFDAFSFLHAMHPASRIEHDGKVMSAEDVARWLHDKSGSTSLQRQSFDKKWEQAGQYGARKCATIGTRSEACKACPHNGKIVTPLALKSKAHIGTAEVGYWVRGENGNCLYPHYGDLGRMFSAKFQHYTTKDERVMAFKQSHYKPIEPMEIKTWLEETVTPTDPLREQHRNEFVYKVKAVGGAAQDEAKLERSTHGMLNCANGVLNIKTGQMVPHSPDFGFKYVLPYEYNPTARSELFLDWLDTITRSRTELMETILDIMAYCLWPTYDDHMFAYLVGEGANGKSTLMGLIRELVGRENCSAVSGAQLAGNRFAPADLEGKLVNLSEEASGYSLNVEQLNLYKTLSAGDEIFVEQKGKQGYAFKNKAKLLFSANRPPVFKESGHAIKRRLLVVPFDYTIENPDPGIYDKLVAEIPGILNILVDRIRLNVSVNSGLFRIFRGGYVTKQAQTTLLTAGNTAVQWAQECTECSIEVPADSYVSTSEAYAHYREWCKESGIDSPVPRRRFTVSISEHVLPSSERGTANHRIGNAVVKVFKRMRWRKEE